MAGFADPDDADTIRIPFIFVPHGDPLPTEWLRDHPEAFRVPATMVWREGEDGEQVAAIALDFEAPHQSAASDGAAPPDAASTPIQLAQVRTLLRQGLSPLPPTHPTPGTVPPPAPAPSAPGWTDWAMETVRRLYSQPTVPMLGIPMPLQSPAAPPAEANPQPDRNAGLPPPLRAHPSRARAAARIKEGEMAEGLTDQDWQAHHLINAAAAQRYTDLLSAAARAGWSMDDPDNIVILPTNAKAQAAMRARGYWRPLHDNPHPNWNAHVKELLDVLEGEVNLTANAGHTELRDQYIKSRLIGIQSGLRRSLSGMTKVVSDGTAAAGDPG